MTVPSTQTSRASLASYLVRYDLAATIEEARQDYRQSSAGGPRLLPQNDISARFLKLRGKRKPGHG